MRRVLMPSVTVVAAALLLQTSASVVAPRFAPAPAEVRPGEPGTELLRTGPGLSIPGLASALDTPPPPATSSPTESPGGQPIPTRVLATSVEPDEDDGEESPTPLPPTADPGSPEILAFVGVSSKRVAPGETLRYQYVAKNTGDRVFRGTLTLTTHTPAGTLRCSGDLGGACVVPGDYSGGSKQPSDSHMNPEAVSTHATIRPGEKQVLLRMRVQVSHAAAEDLVLHNHAHIKDGDKTTTIDAPRVRVGSGG